MYTTLFQQLEDAGFSDWVSELKRMQEDWFSARHHGDYLRWSMGLQMLPEIRDTSIQFDRPAVTVGGDCENMLTLRKALEILRPWRKGPFQFAEIYIDTEWRSDFKWERVHPHLADLNGRRILDVGCGNGYHAWRMLASNPQLVLGIDPSVLFNMQFQAVQHYARDDRIHLLPLTIQQVPENMQWFDSVFSMGVLYHRRSPIDHLLALKGLLKPGGEVCLETLIIPGQAGQVLMPASRYARMNNVWFLPSADELVHWMKRCGFINCRIVDINRTTTEEQRSSEWMSFESLVQCLDPDNAELTVEGYPAPLRAVVLANK